LLAATAARPHRRRVARLVAALGTADVIAAEDTRRLRTLASALDVTIRARVVSHYDAVEATRARP